MKTRIDLLVRDALAEAFVRAAAGDAESAGVLEALSAWAGAPDAAHPGLEGLRTEHGDPLFEQGRLGAVYAELEPYIRDRAARFEAALAWLRDAPAGHDVVERARAAWDAGLFFEVHELLEPAWLEAEEPRKTALQGLILAGAGLHHLTRDNLAGAGALLRDAERRLAASPRLGALELEHFAHGVGELGRRIASGQLRHWSELEDLPRF